MVDNIKHAPSPNFNDRPAGTIIASIIIHYSGMECVEDVIAHFQNPEPENGNSVSAHYVICRAGQITNMVCPTKRAWHAGKSQFGCREEFNHFSIGIELYNPGHNRGYIAYTNEQIASAVDLVAKLYKRYPIKPELVLGHSDISPERKQDPGELFPWEEFTSRKLAIRPENTSETQVLTLRHG